MKKKPDRRLDFLKLVPDDAKNILDVGCGHANLTSHLMKNGRKVCGIDRDPNVMDDARSKLSEAHCLDLEKGDVPYAQKSFDCLIFADVLDCLVDPVQLLIKYRDYVKDDGCVVVSMANVRYYKVIANLLFKGAWDYVEPGGILWWHHLRFYTLLTSQELFLKAGFEVEEITRHMQAKGLIKFMNIFCLGKLKELMVYQYYFRLRKQNNWTPGSFKEKRKIEHF